MTNKKSKDGLSVLLRRFAAGGMTLCMAASALPMAAEAAAVKEHSVRPLSAVNDISYTESTANTHDPYKGFYHAIQINFKRDKTNCATVEKKLETINEWVGEYDLVHLRIDLSDFSKQDMKGPNATYHSSDAEIDANNDDVEEALRKLLNGIRANGQTAVIRFAYDYEYSGKTKDGVYDSGKHKGEHYYRTVWEPESDATILQHQDKVGAVVAEYPDVIACLECGIIGPWGEIHTSDRKTPKEVKLFVENWLEVLKNKDITVNVRTPEQYAWYLGYDDSNTKNVLKNMSSSSYITKIGTYQYKVGVYNDGYQGSSTDLGTFRGDRKQEIAWLSNQAKHTLYGGEIAAWDDDEDEDIPHTNNVDDVTAESFSTHTAYLNKGWNETVTDVFRETSYKSGSSTTNSKRDPVYLKSGITQYDYLQNHMGYRFVVKDVKLTKETTVYENFSINTKIENVGFGNLIKNEKAKLIIKGNGKQQTYDLSALNKKVGESAENYDPRYWDSGKDINNKGVTYLTATVDIPDSFPTGDYKVYLKIANDVKDQGEYPVHFANEGDIFDESLNANFLGNFKIVAGTKLTDSSSQAASSSSSKAPAVSSSKPATASSSKAPAVSSSKPATASSSKASTKSSSKPATASSSKASTKSSSKPATASSSKASTKSSSKPATASSSKAPAVSSSKPATASSSKAPAVSSSKPATASSSKASAKSSSKPATASSSKASTKSSSKPATASSSKAPAVSSSKPATASSSKASTKSSSKPATASSSKASTKSSSKPATASSSKAPAKSSSKPATASSSKAPAVSSSKPATASSSKASTKSSSKPATASSSKAPAVSSSKPATASSSKAPTKSSSKPATASSSKAPAVSSSKPATASSSKAPVAASRRPSRSSSVAEISSAANIFEPDSSSYVSASSLLTDETSSETSSIADSSSKPQRELNEWKVTKKATCTEDGTEARISADGITEERAISALGHDDELISETAPSYGHDGEKLYVCKHCGRARIETIPWESDTTGDEDETIMRGDVDANGSVNVTDIALTAAHIKGIKALDYAAIKRADVNTDGNVNVTDIAMIAAHIKGIKAIK